jgi:hypothetical protein
MKQLFIAALATLFIGTSAFAGPAAVNAKVVSHFSAAFKSAKEVTWTATEQFNKASFVLNNEQVNAFYDPYGNLIGTSKTMKFDKLPKNAIETIVSGYSYPEYQLQECIEFVNAKNETSYYVSMESLNESIALEISPKGKVSLFNKKWK